MPNQVHLLSTPADEQGMSRMMQSVGRRYGAAFNRRHQRSGTLWEGRFRAAVIDPARHFLEVCVYMDTHPVRAGLVERDEDWRWSSLAQHLGRKADALVADHPAYWALGNTPFEREAAYRGLCERGLGSSSVERITDSALKGWALGGPAFLAALAASTSRPLQPRPRGRPARLMQRNGSSARVKKPDPN
jgi:putative transposase